MKIKSKLVYGVGINDSNTAVQLFERVNNKNILIWRCPFYTKWKDMLTRGYSVKFKEKNPAYVNCKVCDEWLIFSNFKAWMETQNWKGKHLDKDLLGDGKLYSPDTCCFLDHQTNCFLADRSNTNETCGAHWDSRKGKFIAQINENGKRTHLGNFDDIKLAHDSWKDAKIKQAEKLAELQTDERVIKALLTYLKEI